MAGRKKYDPEKMRQAYLSDSDEQTAEVMKETAPAEPDTDAWEPDPDLHKNHRDRLRRRFIQENGFDSFTDVQILELLLFYAKARGDTNPLAHELLDEFGSLKSVLEARPEMLQKIKGVGPQAATLISMVVPLTRVWNRCAMVVPDRIGNSREAEKYCKSILAGHRTERFYVVALNAQCKILGQRKISEGSLSEVSAYPRMVMETALNYNAHSVLLCHNHPGGTCAPSPEDISSTLQLQRLLNGVGILVLDHIIVAGTSTYSMIEHGDIDYRTRR